MITSLWHLQNCKEKLDALAKAVKAKWGSKGSGKVVKLKVISAYDTAEKRRHHTEDSLHHEGRAVDLATDDRDKKKLGELGKMAYEAGFDWVNYASKSYIHASVKIGNTRYLDLMSSSVFKDEKQNSRNKIDQSKHGETIF